MRGVLAALSVAATMLTGGASVAQVVVELYTSQGCSSCPPADRLLSELTGRDDVIPLALHVDYWDYIGWKDIYGNPSHTVRQKGYARAAGHRTVYTPQMIVDGKDHVVGFKPMKLAHLIETHKAKPAKVTLSAKRDGDRLTIRAEALEGMSGECLVQVVRYLPEATVSIGRGENAGETFTYHNIVTEWQIVGGWKSDEPLTMTVDAPGSKPAVVILQVPGHGEILAAALVK